MLENDIAQLVRENAPVVASQIRRQPKLWEKVLDLYHEVEPDVNALVGRARAAAGVIGGDTPEDGVDGTLAVVLTGSGSALDAAVSAAESLSASGVDGCDYLCAAADDLVRAPKDTLRDAEHVLLVALSCGDDPALGQAVAAVRENVEGLFVLGLTCDPADGIASAVVPDEDGLVIALPDVASAADEKATAEASLEPADLAGFTCLTLMANLCLGADDLAAKDNWTRIAVRMGEMVVMRETALSSLVLEPFDSLVFLASGTHFQGVVREAVVQAANFAGLGRGGVSPQVSRGDLVSAAGDRDVTHDALAVAFIGGTDDEKVSQVASLKSLEGADNGCTPVAVQQDVAPVYPGRAFSFDGFAAIPAAYLALPYLMAAQVLLLMASVK